MKRTSKIQRLSLWMCLLALVVTPARADEPKLELALHELGAVAKKAGFQKLVVVARLESSSGQATDQELNAVEQLAVTALNKEDGLKGASHEDARAEARKVRARKALSVDEANVLKNTAATDAVVALDYRVSKERNSVRLALSDGKKIQFAETVTLAKRVGSLDDLIGKKQPAPQQPVNKQPGAGAGPIGGNGGQFVQDVPPGATGYAISQPNGNPNFVRKPNAAAEGAAASAKADAEANANSTGTKNSKDGKSNGGFGGGKSTGGGGGGGAATAGGGGLAVAGAAGGTGTPAPGAAATEVGQRILQFAISNLGKQVGNGECWTLAADAMKAAGAQPPNGYTFGDEIPLRSIRPGDILQFTTARFDEPGYYAIMGTPNHTAVVYSIAGDRVFMLHQNFNGKRTVSTFDFSLSSLTSGRLQAYRARAR